MQNFECSAVGKLLCVEGDSIRWLWFDLGGSPACGNEAHLSYDSLRCDNLKCDLSPLIIRQAPNTRLQGVLKALNSNRHARTERWMGRGGQVSLLLLSSEVPSLVASSDSDQLVATF